MTSFPVRASNRPRTPPGRTEGSSATAPRAEAGPSASTLRNHYSNVPPELKTKIHQHLANQSPSQSLNDLQNLAFTSRRERYATMPAKNFVQCRVRLDGVRNAESFQAVFDQPEAWRPNDSLPGYAPPCIHELQGGFLAQGLMAAAASIEKIDSPSERRRFIEMIRGRSKGIGGEIDVLKVLGKVLVEDRSPQEGDHDVLERLVRQPTKAGDKKIVLEEIIRADAPSPFRLQGAVLTSWGWRLSELCAPWAASVLELLAQRIHSLPSEEDIQLGFEALHKQAKLNTGETRVLARLAEALYESYRAGRFNEEPGELWMAEKFDQLRIDARGSADVLVVLAVGLHCFVQKEAARKAAFHALKNDAKQQPDEHHVWLHLAKQLACLPEEDRADEWDVFFWRARGEPWETQMRLNLAAAIQSLPAQVKRKKVETLFGDKPVDGRLLHFVAAYCCRFFEDVGWLIKKIRLESVGHQHEAYPLVELAHHIAHWLNAGASDQTTDVTRLRQSGQLAELVKPQGEFEALMMQSIEAVAKAGPEQARLRWFLNDALKRCLTSGWPEEPRRWNRPAAQERWPGRCLALVESQKDRPSEAHLLTLIAEIVCELPASDRPALFEALYAQALNKQFQSAVMKALAAGLADLPDAAVWFKKLRVAGVSAERDEGVVLALAQVLKALPEQFRLDEFQNLLRIGNLAGTELRKAVVDSLYQIPYYDAAVAFGNLLTDAQDKPYELCLLRECLPITNILSAEDQLTAIRSVLSRVEVFMAQPGALRDQRRNHDHELRELLSEVSRRIGGYFFEGRVALFEEMQTVVRDSAFEVEVLTQLLRSAHYRYANGLVSWKALRVQALRQPVAQMSSDWFTLTMKLANAVRELPDPLWLEEVDALYSGANGDQQRQAQLYFEMSRDLPHPRQEKLLRHMTEMLSPQRLEELNRQVAQLALASASSSEAQ